MTPERFISMIEDCYGAYPKALVPLVLKYLSKKNGEYISILSKLILEKHSTKFGKPPGIADFVEADSEILDLMQAEQMRSNGMELSSNLLMIADEGEEERRKLGIEYVELLCSRFRREFSESENSRMNELENILGIKE